jgi:putative endonuclease
VFCRKNGNKDLFPSLKKSAAFIRLWMTSNREYYVYIITNKIRTVLYTGVTNDLCQRILEHYLNRGKPKTFAGRYNCHFLLYYECFQYVDDAIAREKQIKKWPRKLKDELITSFNPLWQSLNLELFDKLPPDELFHRGDV